MQEKGRCTHTPPPPPPTHPPCTSRMARTRTGAHPKACTAHGAHPPPPPPPPPTGVHTHTHTWGKGRGAPHTQHAQASAAAQHMPVRGRRRCKCSLVSCQAAATPPVPRPQLRETSTQATKESKTPRKPSNGTPSDGGRRSGCDACGLAPAAGGSADPRREGRGSKDEPLDEKRGGGDGGEH